MAKINFILVLFMTISSSFCYHHFYYPHYHSHWSLYNVNCEKWCFWDRYPYLRCCRHKERSDSCTSSSFFCSSPFPVRMTWHFFCLDDSECPKGYKCCRDSCFAHNICAFDKYPTTTTISPSISEDTTPPWRRESTLDVDVTDTPPWTRQSTQGVDYTDTTAASHQIDLRIDVTGGYDVTTPPQPQTLTDILEDLEESGDGNGDEESGDGDRLEGRGNVESMFSGSGDDGSFFDEEYSSGLKSSKTDDDKATEKEMVVSTDVPQVSVEEESNVEMNDFVFE